MIDQLPRTGVAHRPGSTAGRWRPWANVGVQRLLLVASLLALWELAAVFLFNPFWSSKPSLIAARLAQLVASGEFFRHTSATLSEAGIGLVLAALVGIPLGIALARSPHVARVVDPVVMGLYGLPRVALAPLFVLWFGIGLASKVMMSFSMVVFVFLLNVQEGIRTIDRDLLDLMTSMRASSGYLVRKVLLPAVVPWILASLRIGVGLALIGAVVGELIGANKGLGWYIEKSAGQLDTTGVFTGLVVLMGIAMACNHGIAVLERRMVAWRN